MARQPKAGGRRRRWQLLSLLALVVSGIWLAGQLPAERAPLAIRTTPGLDTVRSWGYQLQNVRAERIPEDVDLLVVDYSRDGTDEQAYSAREVDRLRERGGGRRPRIVLAYMSIGEAESYRYYWWRFWRFVGPPWLGRENADWQGNYLVRYCQKSWQSIIVRPEPSRLAMALERLVVWRKPYIDRILEAGFDGVYLDKTDAYGDWRSGEDQHRRDMAAFVTKIARHARARKPGFLIVPQNGEELLGIESYRQAVDAVAKEDLHFGIDGDGVENADKEVTKTLRFLRLAKEAGKPVLVVEYLKDPLKRAMALQNARALGFVPHFAERGLEKPPEPPPES